MNRKSPRRFKILLTITILFTGLIVIFGLIFRQFIYWQTSTMLENGYQRYFSQINQELSLDYLSVHKAVAQTVHIISRTDLHTAQSLPERLTHVAVLKAALRGEPLLSGLQVGYDNGDYFIVRPINNDYLRNRFHAPEGAAFVVDNITAGSDKRRYMERIWYTDDLTELSRLTPVPTEYDPRVRPWYIQALQHPGEATATKPYFFHFLRQTGLTISYKIPELDIVIAGDIPLHYLSETIAKYRETVRSELILIEKSGADYLVTAYRDPDKLITDESGEFRRTSITDIGSETLNFAAQQPDFLSSFYNLDFNKEQWIGSAEKLNLPENETLFLIQLAPENELLVDAHKMRDDALKYTMVMILCSIPLTWFIARKISTPLQNLAKETKRISHFEFSSGPLKGSFIKEVDDLSQAMTMMELTIDRFISLISSLASEQDFDKLLARITRETMSTSDADAAFSYIVTGTEDTIKPGALLSKTQGDLDIDVLPTISMTADSKLVELLNKGQRTIAPLKDFPMLPNLHETLGLKAANVVVFPLRNRQGDPIGLLCLIYNSSQDIQSATQAGRIAFTEALSGFAAVTLESRKMLRMQKQLLDSFIKLLAGAIDSKSPYTGGHCMRVPEMTKLLARKACEVKEGPFAEFSLTEEQWEALHIASWLHDCGKVTTPEFVVDKATKLECIYDRIHEIRMRFEVLKRDAHLNYWEKLAAGGNQLELYATLEQTWQDLDNDFYFIAECNLGGEFMEQEKIEKLKEIAARTWTRTIDDRQGIAWEELQRKKQNPDQQLPVEEYLLADKREHLLYRNKKQIIPADNEYGFVLDTPEYLYNRGELYNLSIGRGTLTNEDRYIINDHIVQTIIMLKQLPYPKHLRDVPNIAGGHHEKIDGTGYPRRLKGEEMSTEAKIMVIADIYEALTASDRPYKKGKNLGQVLAIMNSMKESGHIDPDLFRLFLTSGAYIEYANQYLKPEQLVEVDISQYIQA